MRRKLKLLVFISAIIVITVYSCDLNNSDKEYKRYSNDIFSISYPENIHVKDYPLTQYNGFQVLDTVDTLFYNVGYIVSNLSEQIPDVTFIPDMDNFVLDSGISLNDFKYTNRRNFDIDRYRKQNIFYLKDGNLVKKYTFPIDTLEGGLIGLYIDSMSWNEREVVQFNAFVVNPSSGKNRLIQDALKTVNVNIKPDSFYARSKYVH